jgi:hypothetical protein
LGTHASAQRSHINQISCDRALLVEAFMVLRLLEQENLMPHSTLFSVVAKRAGSMGQSVDFCGYWQRSKNG